MALHPIRIEGVIADPAETVRVTRWLAAPDARVAQGDLLAVVETAKADLEVEAPRAGWLAAIHVAQGAHALIGATLGLLADAPDEKVEPRAPAGPTPPADAALSLVEAAPDAHATPEAAPRARQIASPRARRAAAQAGVDLDGLAGSGPNGRIVERDVTRAARRAPQARRCVPIVLLHGFGADRSLWRQVTPLLGDVETIALDLPGHGALADQPAFSLDDIAFHLSDALDALGVGQAHLVGHSLGAAAALSLADLGRVAVRSLTLIAPAGLGPEIDAAFVDLVARARDVEAWTRAIARMVADPSALPAGYAQAAARAREGKADDLAAMAQALFPHGRQSADLRAALARQNAPTRLLWGRRDAVIPPTHAQGAPGFVALNLLEGVGHVPPVEAPALTARLILETARSAG
jgi:pyruvate dehydrogenase E2 component (dihydrolipoamide acetyltransferase)